MDAVDDTYPHEPESFQIGGHLTVTSAYSGNIARDNSRVHYGNVYDAGCNCLFHCVSSASCASNAKEFLALQTLLAMFDDIMATDARRNDVFAYVNEMEDWIYSIDGRLGNYKQDLWYRALRRVGLDERYKIAPCT